MSRDSPPNVGTINCVITIISLVLLIGEQCFVQGLKWEFISGAELWGLQKRVNGYKYCEFNFRNNCRMTYRDINPDLKTLFVFAS